MEAILLSLGAALGAALFKVAEKIAEKVVELSIEPTAEMALGKMLKGVDKTKAAQELRGTMIAALDAMRTETTDPFERLKITNWVTGQSADTHQLLAAAAVEMVDLDARRIPAQLLTALGLDDSRRDLLARFLVYLRKKLAGSESFAGLIAYANDLEARGSLAGLTREVEAIGQDTRRIRSLVEQMAASQGLSDDDTQALDAYLEHCRARWSRLMLPLVRKNVGLISPSLKRVFVPLLVRDEKAEEQARKEAEKRRLRSRLDEPQEPVQPVDFYQALAKYSRFILVGLPGTGKTTLLRRAALAFAEGRAAEDLGWSGEPKLPIFVRLRNFGIYLAENREKFSAPGPGALVAYLEQHLRNDEGINIPHDFFEKRLAAGGCAVLLDGLDEVLENRVEVAQSVNAFIARYSKAGNHIGLSSRPKGYEGDTALQLSQADLALLEVQTLQPPAISDLIQKLLPLLEPDPEQCLTDHNRLTERILSSKNLTEIAAVPLFCSALVQVYKYHGVELPQRRVDVLAEIVDLLLGYWYAQQTDIRDPERLARSDGTSAQYADTLESVEQKFNRLASLAYFMQVDVGQAEVDTRRAQDHLAAYLREHEGVSPAEARAWAKGFLRSSHEQSGLFVEISPGVYSFLHKNFMEYLAATQLLIDQDEPLETMLAHLDEEWWEQALLLAASHPKTTNPLRKKLIPAVLQAAEEQPKGSPGWKRRLTLAGWMARDMTTRLPAAQREQIVEALYAASTDVQIKPATRADIADTLDELGYVPPDLYTFVQVGNFSIAKYPVTNRQYARFLKPENFDVKNQDLWCGFPKFSAPDENGQVQALGDWGQAGWDWLQGALAKKDYLVENGVLYPRLWRDPRFGITRPSAPVVGVSWWEASAYCKWLQAHWEELEESRQELERPMLLRLPTEPEWQQAAGGTTPRERYAWDKDKEATSELADILQRANIRDSGINRATPVWMYPRGASPAGVLDLSGNVWEWQANFFDKDQDVLSVRGGSWNLDQGYARVSSRSGYHPYNGYYYYGFRVLSPRF